MILCFCMLLLLSHGCRPARSNRPEQIDRSFFIDNSGLTFLSAEAYDSLQIAGKLSAAGATVRARLELSVADMTSLFGHSSLNWWDEGKPSAEQWKSTVLFDGPTDGFLPEQGAIKHHIYAENRVRSIRRLYVIVKERENSFVLYYFYIGAT